MGFAVLKPSRLSGSAPRNGNRVSQPFYGRGPHLLCPSAHLTHAEDLATGSLQMRRESGEVVALPGRAGPKGSGLEKPEGSRRRAGSLGGE